MGRSQEKNPLRDRHGSATHQRHGAAGVWSWRTIAGRRESRKKAAKHTKNPWAARANPDEVISWPFTTVIVYSLYRHRPDTT